MRVVRSLENRLPEVLEALAAVAKSGSYSEGPYLQRVQAQLEQRLHWHSVALFNSCGSALFTIFRRLRDLGHVRAAVQNNTFYATGGCAAQAGMTVTLVDSRPDCPSMSVGSLDSLYRRSNSFSVVVLTHVGGWLAKDYHEIAEWCRKHGKVLIEDCAHASGLKLAGSLGYASAWSFYPTKAVPCGEGGAISTPDPEFADWARKYASYGKTLTPQGVTYTEGMNLRMSEWDAAVLSVQLDALDDILAARRADALALQSIAPCLLTGWSNFYKYPVAAEHAQGLKTVGKVYSLSDQLETSMQHVGREIAAPLDNSRAWARTHACLPVGEGLYTGLTTEQISTMLRDV